MVPPQQVHRDHVFGYLLRNVRPRTQLGLLLLLRREGVHFGHRVRPIHTRSQLSLSQYLVPVAGGSQSSGPTMVISWAAARLGEALTARKMAATVATMRGERGIFFE